MLDLPIDGQHLRHLAFQILDLLSNRAEALQQKLSIFVSLYQAFQAVRIHSSMVPMVPMVLCHGIHDETQNVGRNAGGIQFLSGFGGFKTCQHLSKHKNTVKNTPVLVQKEGTHITSAIELVQRSLNLKIHRSFL